MIKVCITLCGFLLAITAAAQTSEAREQLDSVTIVTKRPTARKNTGKVTSSITQEMLSSNPGKTVAQWINEVSGIEINGSSGNEGQNIGYFVRGGRNTQVLILVDGVALSDPSQIANDYDLRLLPLSAIDRIEIIKGASSVLYGSGAATAVISITTRKTSEAPVAATFTSSYGTNSAAEDDDSDSTIEAFTNHVAFHGTLRKFFYRADFGNRYTNGLSAVAAPAGEPPFESDRFNRINGRFNLGYQFSENVKMSQFFSFDKFKAGFDDFSYEDANHLSVTEQLRTGGNFEWKYSNGIYVFNDTYTWVERAITSGFPARYDSKAYNLDNYVNHKFSEHLSVMVGFGYQYSAFNAFTIPFGGTTFIEDVNEDNAKFNGFDPYVNFVYSAPFGLNLSAGMRLNTHSSYEPHLVYQINPSYGFRFGKGTMKLLGSYSTAFITPSLYQVFDPLYGNNTLLPEENATIEGGFEFTSEKEIRISAIYFRRNEKNYIDFILADQDQFEYQYRNTDEVFETGGVEVEISKRFFELLRFSANYTFTQADAQFALRIPKHKINGNVSYQINDRSTISAQYRWTDDREDSYFDPVTFENTRVVLGAYNVLDLNASTNIGEHLTLFAALTNVLNTEYEELYRYQTLGRNLNIGFTLRF
ncbi:TonB-dependent receptor plug domain-containing protein [Altibacter sp.]|uniref:TonB-dependent receptor plug domain-containing protein n=1 Tax=Altibacter sp. TaxID=2024823 RepID=UPI002588C537|nr:TonB-dependent receptor plug domain-containing protein [Altibacter sp.]MCW9036330.1 TonB-dependent receptor [Altibacter sp.]